MDCYHGLIPMVLCRLVASVEIYSALARIFLISHKGIVQVMVYLSHSSSHRRVLVQSFTPATPGGSYGLPPPDTRSTSGS